MVAEKKRVPWIDYAKGLSIILVVSTHSMFAEIDSSLYSDNLFFLNNIIVHMRMPLFFFVSGLFIHKAMTCNREDFLKTKVFNLFYLYVLWSIIVYVTKTLPDYYFFQYSEVTNLENILTIFYAPTGMLWFIYALLIFMVITRLAMPSLKLVFIFSITCYLFVYKVGISGFLGDRLITNYPFFLLGYLLSRFTLRATDKINSLHLLVPVLYLSTTSYLLANEISTLRIVELLLSFTAIAACIITVVSIANFKCFSWLGYVGRNTLPIYVMHFFPIGVLRVILPKVIPNQPYLAAVIMVSTSVIFPLLFLMVTRRHKIYWLFQIPSSWFDKVPSKSAIEKTAE